MNRSLVSVANDVFDMDNPDFFQTKGWQAFFVRLQFRNQQSLFVHTRISQFMYVLIKKIQFTQKNITENHYYQYEKFKVLKSKKKKNLHSTWSDLSSQRRQSMIMATWLGGNESEFITHKIHLNIYWLIQKNHSIKLNLNGLSFRISHTVFS